MKNFFKVSTLTDEFLSGVQERIHNPSATVQERNAYMLLKQAEIQLAIAQQLSVISGHLGRLVELCERVQTKE